MRRALAISVAVVLAAAACGVPAPTSPPAATDAGSRITAAPASTAAASVPTPAPAAPTAVGSPAPPAAASVAPSPTAPTLDGSPTGSPGPSSAGSLAPVAGTWERLGDLPAVPDTAYDGILAVALADGRIVAIPDDTCGGWSMFHGPPSDPIPAAVLAPGTGRWTQGAALNAFRSGLVAVGLKDGRVLAVGGNDGWGRAYSSTKVFDPRTRRWSNGALLATARTTPAAAALADGRILVAGGSYSEGFAHEGDRYVEAPVPAPVALASAEVYDPATGRWSAAADLIVPIAAADAWTLPDGRVLVASGATGYSPGEAELYDPAADTWTRAGIIDRPYGSTSALLDDGSLLVVGGVAEDAGWEPIATVRRLDPETGIVTELAPLPAPRTEAAAATLADGRVLVVGGTRGGSGGAYTGGGALDTAVVYDPARDAWTPTAPMPFADYPGSAVLLPDGSVIVAGGAIPFDEPVVDVCGRPAVGWTARFTLGSSAP